MKTACPVAVLFFCTSSLLSGPVPPTQSTPLTAPPPCPESIVLVRDSKPCAVVLIPEAPDYRELAADLVRALEERTGIRFPTAAEAAYALGPSEAQALFVLGNAGTGPLALRLYANHLMGADNLYPGPDGHEFRTMSNTLDLGSETIVLGGSSPEGVRAAIAALVARIDTGPPVAVPHTIDWRCATAPAPAPVSDAEAEKHVQAVRGAFEAFRWQQYRDACGHLTRHARSYFLSGDDSYARLCARIVHVLADEFEKGKAEPPTFVMHALAMAVDQVEESPAWTDNDRLHAAEWLRQMAEATMGYWEMRKPVDRYKSNKSGPIWNHETHPALGLAHIAQFLKSRYDIPAADYWEAVIDFLFQGQISCDQPLEDSGGYQWSVPLHTIEYCLATGRLWEYFTNGVLAQCMEYAIASHDAHGFEAAHGDVGSVFHSSAGPLFAHAVAVLRDPRCQAVAGFIQKSAPRMWGYPRSVPAQLPDDHVGLRLFTIHPDRIAAYGIEGIPPERALDKAVFRSGWETTDDYIMLDGLNVGNHKHLDANAIIRFSTQRRFWLVDGDYIRAAPKHHNSISVVRNGVAPDQSPASRGDAQVIAEPPFAAELLNSALGRDAAITQSRLKDYGGLDWTRTLFWKARDMLVVIDTLEAVKPGDYIVRCYWRTLGQADLDGNALTVTQKGQNSRGNDTLRVRDDGDRTVVEFLTKQAVVTVSRDMTAGTYHINPVAKGISGSADSLWVRLNGGTPVAHHIPIDRYGGSSASWEKTAPGPPLEVPEDGTHQLQITLREGPGVCLDHIVITAPDGSREALQAEDLVADQIEVVSEPEQHFQIVNADGVPRKLRRTFDYGHARAEGYYADYPYADKMTNVQTQTQTQRLAAGETITFANLLYLDRGHPETRALMPAGDGVWVVTGPQPTAIGLALNRPGTETGHAGPFMLDTNSLTVADAERGRSSSPAPDWALNLLNKARTDAHPPQQPTQPRDADLPPLTTIRTHELDSQVTALASRNAQLLAGTENGTLVLIGAAGNILWTRDLKSGIRTVAFADFADTGPACLAGTWAGAVCALSASTGDLMWTYDCQPFHGRTGAVATVFPADLDGDGKDEVVAGSNNWHYHGLSPRGELLWRTNTTHASTAGAAGDHDGDGRDEVMAGTEYYWPRLLDDTGKLLRHAGAGPVTSAAAMFDADGDGRAEAIFGMEDGFLRAFRNAKLDWRANVGGAPTAILPFDADGNGVTDIVCGSESCSVYAWQYGMDTPLWRTQLPDSINDVTVVGRSLLAACDNATLYRLTHDGTVTAAARFNDPVSIVRPLDREAAAAAAGSTVTILHVSDESRP